MSSLSQEYWSDPRWNPRKLDMDELVEKRLKQKEGRFLIDFGGLFRVADGHLRDSLGS